MQNTNLAEGAVEGVVEEQHVGRAIINRGAQQGHARGPQHGPAHMPLRAEAQFEGHTHAATIELERAIFIQTLVVVKCG
jgi:hypothetical protein